ncbi:hypothetical protein [Pontibacter beigongshangensis]|uniref:hypothetical protein n=1 Tax=Pontibacter beigongshangensis TaxID=2574733 RepID=UPI001650B4CD|nr:hypothetical protein [Pontibacter beigongshangensis]
MNKRKLVKIILIAFLLYSCKHFYNNFLTAEMIPGVYVNTNFDYTPFLVEIPYGPDTLTLFKDGHFSSRYWGTGAYKLTRSIKGSEIRLQYTYEAGTASFQAPIERNLFGRSPRIVLYKARDHHYEKID